MLISLAAPATSERGPRYMEKALVATHQATYLRQSMSLELGMQERRVALFLRSLHKMEDFFVFQITVNDSKRDWLLSHEELIWIAGNNRTFSKSAR